MKFAFKAAKVIAIATVGLLTVAGCAAETSGDASTDAKVVIQYNPTLYSWLGIIAEKQGFFDENGIDAELKQIDNGTLATTALASGDVTLAFQDLSLVSPYLNKGQDFTAISATGKLSWDMVAPSTGSTLPFPESVKALKGKKVGVPALGSVAYYYARAYLKEAGVNPDDVQYVAVGAFAQVPAVIANKQVDAALVTPDQTLQLQKSGKIDVLFSALKDKENVSPELAKVIGTPGAFYFAQTSWATANTERTAKVQRALVEAEAWAQDPKNLKSLTKMLTEMKLLPTNFADQKALEEFVSYAVGFVTSQATVEDMQAYVNFWKSAGVLKADVTGEKLLSDSIPTVEEATAKPGK